jgi:hypothetical protein
MSEAVTLQTHATKATQSNSFSFLLQRKCACGGSSGLTGNCTECEKKKLLSKPLQAKSRVNEPGDQYEQEADRVTGQVMRMPDATPNPKVSPARETPVVQRKISGNSAAVIGTAPPIVRDVLSAPGQPLDASARAFFEPRFGHDFGHVRVHSDAEAAESARAVNAIAYTVGGDIVFDSARYEPSNSEGRRLLAHELTHSIQQSHDESASTTDAKANDVALPVAVTGVSPIVIARQSRDEDEVSNSPSQQSLFENPDPESAIRVAIDTLASIRFVEADRYVLEAEGEVYELNERQYQELKISTRAKLRAAINTLRTRSRDVQDIYAGTLETNDDYWQLTKIMEFAFGVEKPGEKLTVEFVRARIGLDEAEEALATNEYAVVLEQLVSSEIALVSAEQMVDAYRHELDATAETIAQGSIIVRNVSVGVLIGIGAVLAAPVVAAGFTGLGVTGFSGTALTTVGTGTLVTGGGALTGAYFEAGINVTEQALEGEEFDWQEFWSKTGAGGKLGATSALSGATTAGAGYVLGEGTTLTGQALRGLASGYAGGASGSGLGAALEGKSLWEIAKAYQLGGLEGAVGGVFGGATGYLTRERGLIFRLGLETLGGGLSSGLGAYAVGKSPEEIAQGVLLGFITSGAAELGAPSGGKPKTPGSLPKPAAWEIVGEDVDYGIVIFKAGEEYVGIHPEYPDTVFIPQGNSPPKVFARNPDGSIAEVPWPFQRTSAESAEAVVAAGISPEGPIPAVEGEAALHDPSRLPAEEAVSPPATKRKPGKVVAARVNKEHTLTLVRAADGNLELILCSPRCRQLIALLDDLSIRSGVQYRDAILALRERTTMVLEAFPVYDPQNLEAVQAVNELAGRVETLRNLIGEETMFEGGRIPFTPWRDVLTELNRITFRNPLEEAVPSLALSREMGIYAPREFTGDASAVTRRVLGDPPDFAAAFERVPRIPYDTAIDWPLRARLYSHTTTEGATGAPVYLTTLRVEGEPRMVAVKHFQRRFDNDQSYIQEEILSATILGELGVGPRVFGVVEIDGRPGLVMEPVAGDFPEVMTPGNQAVQDLEAAQARMAEAGIAIGDFQYLVTPDGRAVIIDAGGAVFEGDPQFLSRMTTMTDVVGQQRSRLDAPSASRDLRERYGLQPEDPNLIRARAQTSLVGDLSNLLESGRAGAMTVEGVEYSGVHVGLEGKEFSVVIFGIQNLSDVPGQGRLVHSIFEQAAIEAARATGATSARVSFQKVVNQDWRTYLSQEQGYAPHIVDKVGAKGFEALMSKVFPVTGQE